MSDRTIRRLAGLCGLAGGILFFVGDMLMYGHWGAAVDVPAGALKALRGMTLSQLFVGGLLGPVAACLCGIGFWHVYRNLAAGIARRTILVLAVAAMIVLGAVHVLWVAKGLVRRECAELADPCGALTTAIDDYWTAAYVFGIVPAYLACALLAVVVLIGRSGYPRWTILFNPAVSLLVSPVLMLVPAPLGAPLVGGDANLFIAVFFAVSVATTWDGHPTSRTLSARRRAASMPSSSEA